MIEKLAAGGNGQLPQKPKDDPAKIKDAAGQFEALLLGQMLRSIREANSGTWLSGGEDQAGESAMALAEEHLAAALSKSGGLGLSKLIASGLAPKSQE